jgi:hypothetical protein
MVRVLVNVPYVEVRNDEDRVIASQIEPFISAVGISADKYKVSVLNLMG